MRNLFGTSSLSLAVGAALILGGCVSHRDGYNDRNYGPRPPPSNYRYYHEGDYENDCHRGNRVAGTIFGRSLSSGKNDSYSFETPPPTTISSGENRKSSVS